MSLKDELKESLTRIEARKKANWSPRPEILLHPNIPKPLHGVAPRIVLGTAWWNRERQAAYERTDFHCAACGVHKRQALWHQWLEAHELYEIDYLLGQMTYVEAVGLCHFCHCYIHSGRMEALAEKGDSQMPKGKRELIIAHGDAVLKAAGLKKRKPHSGPEADWKDWRLVVNGKRYKPKFRSFEAWLRHFEGKR